jgi:hypothetical protein
MSDFLDITEEQQNDLLSDSHPISCKSATTRRRQIAGAANRFVQLNSKARDLFRRGVGLNTLADVEQRVFAFLGANGTDLECEDMLTPMQRLVAHAVAAFHGCNSRTTNRADGSRAMYRLTIRFRTTIANICVLSGLFIKLWVLLPRSHR